MSKLKLSVQKLIRETEEGMLTWKGINDPKIGEQPEVYSFYSKQLRGKNLKLNKEQTYICTVRSGIFLLMTVEVSSFIQLPQILSPIPVPYLILAVQKAPSIPFVALNATDEEQSLLTRLSISVERQVKGVDAMLDEFLND